MKYLAMSILAIRAIGCLVRGRILCQRFASSWFRIFLEYSQQKTLPCSVYFGNHGDRLPCSLKFSASMGFKKRSDLFGIYVIDLFGFLLLIRSDLFGIYVIDLFGFLLLIRSDLFGIYVINLFGFSLI